MVKNPLLFDLDKMLVGTIAKEGIKAEGSERGMVRIEYFPLNGFKKLCYPHLVRKDAIHMIRSTHIGMPGVEEQVVIIQQNGDDSCMRLLDQSKDHQIKQLKDEVKSLRMQLAQFKSVAQDGMTGVENMIKRVENIKKGDTQDNPMRNSFFDF